MSLIVFAALAGAIQMVAPDRWMPISVFAWQRGWTISRTSLMAFPMFFVHVLLGCALYLALQTPLSHVAEKNLAGFTFLLLGGFGLLRAVHFSRMGHVIHRNPRWYSQGQNKATRGWLPLLVFLGPSEMVLPVLMKARMDQMDPGFLLIIFLAATVVSGSFLVSYARLSWNRPSLLPRAVEWCNSKIAAYPVALSALVGMLLLTSFFRH
jgi:hypothetical protein